MLSPGRAYLARKFFSDLLKVTLKVNSRILKSLLYLFLSFYQFTNASQYYGEVNCGDRFIFCLLRLRL